jgi:hypothetical protein
LVYSKNNVPNSFNQISNIIGNDLNLNSISITEYDIIEHLTLLNEKSSTGPDCLPSILLKNCCFVFAKSINHIFNLSVSTGIFPVIWKKSFIPPIYKSGDRNNIRNYRPITKFSILPKMFEAIKSKKLPNLLTNYISPSQHGFLAKHSILTNLITYHNYLITSLNDGYQVDSIHTDFKKAFDKVDHLLLYHKLELF